MSFLPIVGRELRGASRRRGTYWMRTGVAAVAVLLGVSDYIVNLGGAAAQSGRAIFQGLSGLVMFYCLISGRTSTVDCLSVEKREGTLGLLFLTDLKGYDVVLGKLVATSLNGFYGLVAVMPVLAFSILLGGVSYGEFWRVALVLGDTFLFSLAIGIFCSALSRDARRAMSANFAMLLLFIGVLPTAMGFVAYFKPSTPFIPQLFYTCPIFTGALAFDQLYRLRPQDFWWSAGIIHGLTWLLVILASVIVPRVWQDNPSRAKKNRWREFWQAVNYGPTAGRAPFRRRSLNRNAFYWLASRARCKPAHVWIFLGVMAGWWAWGRVAMGDTWYDGATVVVMALILNSTLKLWVTLEAAQQLAEDQRMGTLELLLPTPLGVRDIVRGQWLALRRQFLRPVLVVIVAEFVLVQAAVEHRVGDRELFWAIAMGAVMLILDVLTLGWVGMRLALTAKSLSRATINAVVRILALPWLGFGLVQLFLTLRNFIWYDDQWIMGWQVALGLWVGLGVAADLLFGLTARHKLLRSFHRLAMHRFHPQPSRLARWFGRRDAIGAEERPVRVVWWRRKRVVFAAALVLVLAVGVVMARRKTEYKYPPPLVVAITQSNTPLVISPGRETFMVMPDGTLWHWGMDRYSQPISNGVPQPVDEGHDWVSVSGDYFGGVAIKREGSLWTWGQTGLPTRVTSTVDPHRADDARDWVSAVTSGSHSLALKKDGTLWAWGNNRVGQIGNGPGTNATNIVQVGTNRDWAAIGAVSGTSLGIKTDGTLWAWGQFMSLSMGIRRAVQVPIMTMVTSDTNWASVDTGSTFPAGQLFGWTTSGELWELPGAPNPAAGIVGTGRQVLTNSRPGGFAVAVVANQRRYYEIHADGTLWDEGVPGSSASQRRQIGERADWVSIWGGNAGTALGLTVDETIWTWGTDWSRKPEPTFSARLRVMQTRILEIFGNRSPGATGGAPVIQPYLENPRPLMRMINAGTTASGGSNPQDDSRAKKQ